MVHITVKRFADSGEATLSAIFIDGVFNCFGVEDEEREVKVKGKTRVPSGTYDLSLRSEGGFNNRYSKKFKDIHKGMLCFHNAPDWRIIKDSMQFQYCLIHCGNSHENSMGCLLINNSVSASTYIGRDSVFAYKNFYPKVAQRLVSGEQGKITFEDIEIGK